jgi:hypothetical protein
VVSPSSASNRSVGGSRGKSRYAAYSHSHSTRIPRKRRQTRRGKCSNGHSPTQRITHRTGDGGCCSSRCRSQSYDEVEDLDCPVAKNHPGSNPLRNGHA